MRKNLISHQEIKQCTKQEALRQFKKAYGIMIHEVRALSKHGDFKRILEAAALILNKSLGQGMPKCDALAQVTSANIAVLATPWEDPSKNIRYTGKVISKHYPETGNGTTKMSLLRQEVLSGLILNLDNPEKNPNGHSFSFYDQVDGLKLKPYLGIEQFFLMGVYRTDGHPANFRKNRFKLSGKTGDDEFYEGILEDLIKDAFNLKVTTHIKPRKRRKDDKIYKWDDVFIEIISKGHFAYLMDYIGLFDRSKNFIPLDIEGFGEDENLNSEYHLSYLMGMIAGGAHIGLRKQKNGYRLLLKLHDKEQRYIPEIKKVIDEKNLPFPYHNPPKKPRYMHFNQPVLEEMASYDVPFMISENQVGLFVNPRHIKALTKFDLIP